MNMKTPRLSRFLSETEIGIDLVTLSVTKIKEDSIAMFFGSKKGFAGIIPSVVELI